MDTPLDSPQGKLDEAIALLEAARKARRTAIIAAVIALLGAVWFIAEYNPRIGTYEVGVLLLILAPALTYRVALELIVRIEKLDVDFFPRRKTDPLPDEAFKTYEVPRLPGVPTPSEAVVRTGAPIEGPSVFITNAGHASAERAGALPEGVIVLLPRSLMFLPAAGSMIKEVVRGVSGSLFNVAQVSIPFLGVLDAAGMDQVFAPEETNFPQWLRQSLQHPDHFVIPYMQIVAVRTSPHDNGINVDVTQETDDGTRHVYRILSEPTNVWPDALMHLRMRGDLLAVGHHHLQAPKAKEILPGLRKEFEAIYDDRVDEHEVEIAKELETRINAWLDTIPEDEVGALIRQAMAPVLPHFRKMPSVVAGQPWLFADAPSATDAPTAEA